MKILAIATVASFFLLQGANAQCVAQDDALDVCMEADGLNAAGKDACDLCVKAASTAASTAGVTCEELRNAVDSILCNALAACPTCPGGCSREVYAYALCEINEEQETDCSELTCELGVEPPEATEATSGSGAATTTGGGGGGGAATTTEGDTGATEECPDETSDFRDCLTAAGSTEAETRECVTCASDEGEEAGNLGITCEELSGAGNPLCEGLERCPGCPSECSEELHEYTLCIVNTVQDTDCSDFTCLLGETDPTGTTDGATTTGGLGATEECAEQTTLLNDCLTPAGLDDAQKRICQTCLTDEAIVAGDVGITCETLSGADNALCRAIDECPSCPEDVCDNEMHGYALCVLNEQQNTDCTDFTCLLGETDPTGTTDGATTTEDVGATEECATEDSDLDACLTAAGKGDTEKDACDKCIELASEAAATVGITCETLSGEGNALCTALRDCPTCPSECDTEVFDYALCEVNAEQNTDCMDLTCVLGPGETDTSTQAPPTASPTSSASLKWMATSIVGGLGVMAALV